MTEREKKERLILKEYPKTLEIYNSLIKGQTAKEERKDNTWLREKK